MKAPYHRGMEEWRKRFRARFDYLKNTQGLTQTKLGEEVGVSQATISSWRSEGENRRTPESLQQFEALAYAIGMHPAELLYGIDVEAIELYNEIRLLNPQQRAAVESHIRAYHSPN